MTEPTPENGQSTQSNTGRDLNEVRATALVQLIATKSAAYPDSDGLSASVDQFLSALIEIRRQLVLDVVALGSFPPYRSP